MAKKSISQNHPISQLYQQRVSTVTTLLGVDITATFLEEKPERVLRWSQGRGQVSENGKRRIDQFFKVTGTRSAQLVAFLQRAEALREIMGAADYHQFVQLVSRYLMESQHPHLRRKTLPVDWSFYRVKGPGGRTRGPGPVNIGQAIVNLLMHYGLDPRNRPDTYLVMATSASYHMPRA